MELQLNTDKNIEGGERLSAHVKGVVEHVLSHFSDRLSRVEVHLSDENGAKNNGHNDKRCTMEARIDGHQPIVVTHHSGTVHEAVGGAADRLNQSLTSSLGKLKNRH